MDIKGQIPLVSPVSLARINLMAVVLTLSLFAFYPPVRTSTLASSPSASVTVTVNATDYKFTPRILNITTGTTVVWVNRGPAAHTSTENSTPPTWSSGNLDPGQNYSFRFTTPRVYSYYCGYHGGAPYYMTGSVNVTGQPINTNPNGNRTPQIPIYVIALGGAGALVAAILVLVRHKRISNETLETTPSQKTVNESYRSRSTVSSVD